MDYRASFSNQFDLGFDPLSFPVELVDKSYGNDVCPSFYFQINDCYYVLWVDYEDEHLRECDLRRRYSVVGGVNMGTLDEPEIYDSFEGKEIVSSDDFSIVLIAVYKLFEEVEQ